MGIKQVVVSDVSNKEIPDDKHARVVISNHPGSGGNAVELDVSTDEAQQFQASNIDLVNVTVYEPNKKPREVVLDSEAFETLFKGVSMTDLVKNARAASQQSGGTRKRSGSSSKSQKVDYTAMENIGLIHRGKVTEEEARLVRENMAQANKNREREGQPKVGDDPKDADRYQLG